MTPRAIVSDPAISGGRWHFAATSIFVDDLRRDALRPLADVSTAYRELDLSEDEIDTALAFDFPDVREAHADLHFIDITINCSCGMVRKATVNPVTATADSCPCGRTWHVTTALDLVPPEHNAAPERSP